MLTILFACFYGLLVGNATHDIQKRFGLGWALIFGFSGLALFHLFRVYKCSV